MELRHIRYFLAVAEERHFTRAAAKVGIGQPPLSQQIKDLEAEIGAPLFHRVAHGAELTAAGEAFLEGVREIPTFAERATKAARRASRGETGSLRVGYTASSAFNAVVPAAIRAGLKDGSLDAVFLRPGAAGCEAFQLRLLSEEVMVVALPASHPVAAQDEVNLLILKDDPFLLFPRAIGPTLYDGIMSACREAGFEPKIGQLAPQIASIINFVAAELGVSIVPASMTQLQVSGVAYRPIAGQAPTARVALAHRRGETSVVVRNFITRAVV